MIAFTEATQQNIKSDYVAKNLTDARVGAKYREKLPGKHQTITKAHITITFIISFKPYARSAKLSKMLPLVWRAAGRGATS